MDPTILSEEQPVPQAPQAMVDAAQTMPEQEPPAPPAQPTIPNIEKYNLNRGERYFPQLKKALSFNGQSWEGMTLEQRMAYLSDPKSFIADLQGKKYYNPERDKLEEELESTKRQMDVIDASKSILEGVAEGSLAVAGGGILGGLGRMAPMYSKAAAFVGDIIGGAGGDVAGRAVTQAIDPDENVDPEMLQDRFVSNMMMDTGISMGAKSIGKLASFIGVDAMWFAKRFKSLQQSTDPDTVLTDAVSLSPQDFTLKYDGTTFKDSVIGLRDRIFARSAKIGKSKVELFPVIEERMVKTKRAVNRKIDSVLNQTEAEALEKGIEYNSTARDILDPVEQKLKELSAGSETKALRAVYKTEKDNFAQHILSKDEYMDYKQAEKIVNSIQRKGSRIRVTSDDFVEMENRIRATFPPSKAQKALNALNRYNELERKIYTTPALDLSTQLKFKRQYAKEASFIDDAIRDSGKENKAAAYGVLEHSMRKNLEGAVQKVNAEQFNAYSNLNTIYGDIKNVEANVKLIAAAERGAIEPALFGKLKIVETLNRDGVGVRAFLSQEAAKKGTRSTDQVFRALDLYENPSIIRNAIGEKGKSLLTKYSRSTFEFFAPSNVQAVRSIMDAYDRGEVNLSETAYNTLQIMEEAIASGIEAGEDARQQIMTNLLQMPETAPLFNEPAEAKLSPHLKGVNSIVDGKVLDPTGQEQEMIRQRVIKNEKSPTKAAMMLTPLNTSGSLEGFKMEPEPQPSAPKPSTVKKRPMKVIKKIQNASSDREAFKETVRSRQLESVVEYSRQ